MTDNRDINRTTTDIPEGEQPSGTSEHRELRVLSNGALFDPSTSRIVSGAPMSSAQGRELAAKRQDKAARAVRRAIADGDEIAHDSASRSVYGGVQTIAQGQMLLAKSPEAGRASTEAAKWLLKAGQLVAEDSSQAQAAAVTLSLSGPAVEALGRLLGRRQQLPPGDSG